MDSGWLLLSSLRTPACSKGGFLMEQNESKQIPMLLKTIGNCNFGGQILISEFSKRKALHHNYGVIVR